MKPTGTTSVAASKSSRALLRLAQGGNIRALNDLFLRQRSALSRWARGRLPRWARSALDTNDLVQEALAHTFNRISRFNDQGRGALQAYLREAVRNRIRDEVRRVGRQPVSDTIDDDGGIRDGAASPFDLAADSELMGRYKAKLRLLTKGEQELVVGRIEMGYTYEQLALATGRTTADAARVAVRRAVIKLAREMAE